MSFFGVHRGRSTGVFPGDWNLVKPMVSGYSNPKFKKFKTREEAEYYVNHGEVMPKSEIIKDIPLDVNFSDLYIFTDGSYSTKTNKSAIGISFSGSFHPYNYSEQLEDGCTNQQAELYALAKALEILTQNIEQVHSVSKVEIWTDSGYAIDCVTKWIHGWQKNGWKTSNGNPVLHRNLIEYIFYTIPKVNCDCRIRHIKEVGLKSHKNSKPTGETKYDLLSRMVWEGNNIADNLARELTK